MNAVLCPRHSISFPRANPASGHLAQQCLGGVPEYSCGPQNGVVHSTTLDLQSIPPKQCLENTMGRVQSNLGALFFCAKSWELYTRKKNLHVLHSDSKDPSGFLEAAAYKPGRSWSSMLSSSMFTVVHRHSKYFGFTWECDQDLTSDQQAEEWGIWTWILSTARIFRS